MRILEVFYFAIEEVVFLQKKALHLRIQQAKEDVVDLEVDSEDMVVVLSMDFVVVVVRSEVVDSIHTIVVVHMVVDSL